jgi:hypothetical protein
LLSYKASVKAEMEKSEIIDRQVRRRVNITDEDVERYYKLNSKNYRSNERARIRHILLSLAENAPPDRVQSVMTRRGILPTHRRRRICWARAQYSGGAGRADEGDWLGNRGTGRRHEDVAFQKLSGHERTVSHGRGCVVKLEGAGRHVVPLAA